ncbi:MAG: TolC family protein [bacterium]|nr:TolC family protein [Candidatus Limimorpha caballi]MCQ2315289.1 TolC family protein [Bacteroidales bacterium]
MYKKRRFLTAALCLAMLMSGTVSRAQQAQDSVIISLDEAIKIALDESSTIKIAEANITKAGYAKKGSYAALYPNISANGSYQRTLKKQVMAMDFQGQSMEIAVGKWNNMNAGVSASMPLVNAQLWESLKLSALNVELAVEQARSSKVSMVSQVKQSFYAVLIAQYIYDVYKQVYDNAATNYAQIEKKYNAGKVSEYEYLRAKVNVKNAEPNVYSALASIDLAIWQLKAVMGLDLNTKIGVSGDLSNFEEEMLGFDVNDSLNLENNTTLIQLGLQERQVETTIKMTKRQYIPSLAASFSYSYMAMGDDFDMKWNPYSVVGVTLSIPIFDGLSKRYNIRQNEATRDVIRMNMEDTERQLRIAHKGYMNQIATYIENYHAAESTLEMAQKSYDIAAKMYELGKATLTELNDAQLALVQSQLTMSQAIYNFKVTMSQLEELQGLEH